MRRSDSPRSPRSRSAPVTSVLVDDEAALLRALRINLSARDYSVSTASDGTSGLTRHEASVFRRQTARPDESHIYGSRGWGSNPFGRAARAPVFGGLQRLFF